MNLIDKEKVVAEIRKRLLPVIRDKHYDEWDEGQDSERIAILNIIDTLEVKEVDLEKETKKWWKERLHLNPENQLWMDAHQSLVFAKHFFELGINAKVVDANLWKSADGDDLPELEREVVVFTQSFPNDAGIMKVGIAHRPNPNGWDGRNILTGEVNHYTPKTYDKGGWSIPDVKIWLDCPMPYEEGGEE